MLYFTTCSSPLGAITIQANEEGILGAWFDTHTTKPADLGEEKSDFPILAMAVEQFERYFKGELKTFSLPISAKGTEFQQKVWDALTRIPYGETWSYLDIANSIGNPKSVRAVGAANGKNPISIIVPCHRVIGKDGSLTGYAGGVERKKALLALEQAK